VADTDPDRWIGPRTAFRLATEAGAAVVGLAGELGAIEPGARADLALIDTSGIAWRPRGDVYQHLVMYEHGADVHTVLVEGEVVLREGRCVKVDEAAVLEEAQAIAAEQARANEASLAAVDGQSPILKDLLLGAIRRDVDANRYADLR
jgi:cytosine/adenosine deaminase-related metal-dependent hydrolase